METVEDARYDLAQHIKLYRKQGMCNEDIKESLTYQCGKAHINNLEFILKYKND